MMAIASIKHKRHLTLCVYSKIMAQRNSIQMRHLSNFHTLCVSTFGCEEEQKKCLKRALLELLQQFYLYLSSSLGVIAHISIAFTKKAFQAPTELHKYPTYVWKNKKVSELYQCHIHTVTLFENHLKSLIQHGSFVYIFSGQSLIKNVSVTIFQMRHFE